MAPAAALRSSGSLIGLQLLPGPLQCHKCFGIENREDIVSLDVRGEFLILLGREVSLLLAGEEVECP